jgi:hypothetical protein
MPLSTFLIIISLVLLIRSGEGHLAGQPPSYVWQLTQRYFEKVGSVGGCKQLADATHLRAADTPEPEGQLSTRTQVVGPSV